MSSDWPLRRQLKVKQVYNNECYLAQVDPAGPGELVRRLYGVWLEYVCHRHPFVLPQQRCQRLRLQLLQRSLQAEVPRALPRPGIEATVSEWAPCLRLSPAYLKLRSHKLSTGLP